MIHWKFVKFCHQIPVVMHHQHFFIEANYQRISMDCACQVKILNVQCSMYSDN